MNSPLVSLHEDRVYNYYGPSRYDKGIRVMRKILLCLSLALLTAISVYAGSVQATEVVLREPHPDRYVVERGDTLWDISSMFLKDPWLWPEIWHINPDIENPHLIYPGDVIILTYVEGRPVLRVDRGGADRISRDRTGGDRTGRLPPSEARRPSTRDPNAVVLRQTVRATPITTAIPAIPLDAIASLLTTGRIVDQFTLDNAPYILAGRAEKLIFGPGDEFYARGDWTSNTSVYGLYREGNVYIDPETNELLGFEAREVGMAKVLVRDQDLLTFELTSVQEDVRLGDRLLPTELRRVESTFYPTAPDVEVAGVIMSVMGGVTQVGRNSVVVLNRGAANGLILGNVLAIHKSGSIVRDRIAGERVLLPSERAGLLMIFRIFDRMSYGLVLRTEEPLRVLDKITNP